MRQTKEETERTRSILIEVAEELFWERGATATTVLDIVKGAKLSRGAYYYHFKDKGEIFRAIIERAWPDGAGPGPILDERADDPLLALRNYCMGVFDRFSEDQFQQRAFGIVMHRREGLGDLEPIADEVRERFCRSGHAYERLLRRAHDAGRLAPSWTPTVAATALYSVIMGLLDQWIRKPDRFDVRAVGVACISQLLDSFERKG